ncbi:Serpentine Receptor, class H [Caenorhabditis elegans]|uniref:Serpentine Receptor, class H n=1 Tax=Caenorhabditis elegans TaxID=6239 RepID=Q9U2Z3_CAEEL|nr:Serpentine Receptor, class H [Caenorhabditis elegans]CAB60474.1 Serpentine Receptor, class H [Caenorhabditis elegans]|eukprot:NP_507872.1 Serpentine Receptor, class H [Caenorhabditis elegans]
MHSCSNPYLASPDFLKTAFHVITAIATPIHAFGFYCIIRKTPQHMNPVKWLLFNLHCWCILLDVTISFLGIPYILFPAMAGYGLGPIESPGLFFYLGVTFVTGVTTSIFVTFENRYFILFGESSAWRYFRKPAVVLSYIIVPLYYMPLQFFIPEQESGREISWALLDCIPELPRDGRELFVLATNLKGPGLTIFISEILPIVQCGTFVSLNLYNLTIARPSGMSKKTIQMQHLLIFALILQASVNTFLFIVPVNAVIYIVYIHHQNQLLNNLIVFCLAFHGIVSTLIMIFAHKPYRDFTLLPVKYFRPPQPSVSPGVFSTSNLAV